MRNASVLCEGSDARTLSHSSVTGEQREDRSVATADGPSGAQVSYRQQYRRCGRAGCSRCAGGGAGHGPYWYAYWWEAGRSRSRYLGKQTPTAVDAIAGEKGDTSAGTPAQAASATLRVRTLGAFAVWRGHVLVSPEAWTSRRAFTLFKCLLSAPGHRLRREQAGELLWPEVEPEAGAANLRTTTRLLRQVLDGPGAVESHLRTEGDILVLAPAGDGIAASDWLDATAFTRAADTALAGQDAAACHAALAWYDGVYLPDDLHEVWAIQLRDSLQRRYLQLLLHLAALCARQGEQEEAERCLRRVLAVDRCHEGAAASLMRLLAATDQRHEALRVYQALAAALELELDMVPGAAVEVERARLVAQAVTQRTSDGPPGTPLPKQRTNLPHAPTSFVGRTLEVAQIQNTLATSRLVTVTGSGGCGKTRLALEAAVGLLGSYADGVWLVELSSVADPGLVPRAVAAAVGVQEVLERPLHESLALFLERRQILLLLDNCEHLAAGCATLAAGLLQRCRGVRILATSQASLAAAGEVTLRVPPLALPDLTNLPAPEAMVAYEAVALFVERARVHQSTFRLDARSARSVAEICVRLDGIPLAIELAAARVGVMPVGAVAARLDECVRLLTGGPRTTLPRQQTLQATLAWSHSLLSEPEQVLLRRLTIFAGGCSLEAAEAICSGTGIAGEMVLDLLGGLVDKSLVALAEQDGVWRYQLLETMRQFGFEQLLASGETETLRRRHVAWYLAMAESLAPAPVGPRLLSWLTSLGQDHANLRAALAWSLGAAQAPAEGIRLAIALTWYCLLRGHLTEGRGWLQQSVLLGGAATRSRAAALACIAILAVEQSDFAPAETAAAACLALLPGVEDADLPWGVLEALAVLHLHQGAFDQAMMLQERVLRVAQAAGNRWVEGSYSFQRGLVAFFRGEHAQAVVLVQQSLDVAREVDDSFAIGQALLNLGRIAQAMGEVARGLVLMQEALPYARLVGFRKGIIWSLEGLAQNAWLRGQPERAAQLIGKAEDLRIAVGAPLTHVDLVIQQGMREQVLSALGAPTFADLRAEGKRLALDEAIAYALEGDAQG
jgi:predicted ATPase/DNA-binding SARP family transcriptional activator